MVVAFTELPDSDDGRILVRIGGRNFSIEQDDDGYFLCEILPLESLPGHIRRIVERPG